MKHAWSVLSVCVAASTSLVHYLPPVAAENPAGKSKSLSTTTDGKWYGDFHEGLAQSKIQNKWLFVLISTNWCPHCRKLESAVMPDASVKQFLSKNYVCVKLDGDRGYAKSLQNQYKMEGFPTVMIFAPDGRFVSGSAGTPETADSFILFLHKLTLGEKV